MPPSSSSSSSSSSSAPPASASSRSRLALLLLLLLLLLLVLRLLLLLPLLSLLLQPLLLRLPPDLSLSYSSSPEVGVSERALWTGKPVAVEAGPLQLPPATVLAGTDSATLPSRQAAAGWRWSAAGHLGAGTGEPHCLAAPPSQRALLQPPWQWLGGARLLQLLLLLPLLPQVMNVTLLLNSGRELGGEPFRRIAAATATATATAATDDDDDNDSSVLTSQVPLSLHPPPPLSHLRRCPAYPPAGLASFDAAGHRRPSPAHCVACCCCWGCWG